VTSTVYPSHFYVTEDRTEPCLAELVKDLIEDCKGNRNWTYRSQRFSLEVVLMKDCIMDIRIRDMRRR